ncbi:MAG: PH domain-containing protein, partial [Phycisphaerae bacterium]
REIAKRRGSEEAENADVPAEADNVIWRASAADLFILGSTANRAGVIIGAISGLYFSFQEVIEKNYDTFIRQFPALAHLDRSSAPMIAIALLGLIFIGWLVSILSTFLTYYGFVLRKRDDRLLRQYGLLTNVESVLKQNRIQSLRISSPLLRRLLHRATLYAESAGSFGDKAASGQSPLCPLTTVPRLTELCAVAIPALHYATLQWHPVDRKTIRRGFVRYAFLPCLVLIALGLFYNKLWWIGVPVWLVISVGLAYARYRAMGYVDDPAFVASRYGILTREIRVLPRAKIQHVKLEANPFQRRQGLATLHIATAGANSDVPIIDLPRDDAEALLERLSTDASAAGEWLPDGV